MVCWLPSPECCLSFEGPLTDLLGVVNTLFYTEFQSNRVNRRVEKMVREQGVFFCFRVPKVHYACRFWIGVHGVDIWYLDSAVNCRFLDCNFKAGGAHTSFSCGLAWSRNSGEHVRSFDLNQRGQAAGAIPKKKVFKSVRAHLFCSTWSPVVLFVLRSVVYDVLNVFFTVIRKTLFLIKRTFWVFNFKVPGDL
jgi:hypothetical protein